LSIKNTSRGKYFRIVARVFADGVEVADLLIDQKLAFRYFGGKKQKLVLGFRKFNKTGRFMLKPKKSKIYFYGVDQDIYDCIMGFQTQSASKEMSILSQPLKTQNHS
jgi:endonuclease YncB( thermonuclease family)